MNNAQVGIWEMYTRRCAKFELESYWFDNQELILYDQVFMLRVIAEYNKTLLCY